MMHGQKNLKLMIEFWEDRRLKVIEQDTEEDILA